MEALASCPLASCNASPIARRRPVSDLVSGRRRVSYPVSHPAYYRAFCLASRTASPALAGKRPAPTASCRVSPTVSCRVLARPAALCG